MKNNKNLSTSCDYVTCILCCSFLVLCSFVLSERGLELISYLVSVVFPFLENWTSVLQNIKKVSFKLGVTINKNTTITKNESHKYFFFNNGDSIRKITQTEEFGEVSNSVRIELDYLNEKIKRISVERNQPDSRLFDNSKTMNCSVNFLRRRDHYHRPDCPHIKGKSDLELCSEHEALKWGLKPCKRCFRDKA